MSIFEKLGLIPKQKEHTLDKINRLEMASNISDLFDDQIWLEQNDAEIQRLATQTFSEINKHKGEIDKRRQLHFGDFLVQIGKDAINHSIKNLETKEKILVEVVKEYNYVMVEKHYPEDFSV